MTHSNQHYSKNVKKRPSHLKIRDNNRLVIKNLAAEDKAEILGICLIDVWALMYKLVSKVCTYMNTLIFTCNLQKNSQYLIHIQLINKTL